MAITTIHPIRRTVSAAIRYIIDGDKTGDHSLVQSFMCEGKPDRAAEQFREVRQRVGTGRSTTLAQHLIQSFLPCEVTPEQAMMIGEELCHRLLGEQYQFVIATHIDHSHIHNHIVFNNTNMISGYTFETEHNQGKKSERAWAEIQKLSDDICRENGLSVIEQPKSKGVSHYEYEARKSGISWKEHLRQILKAIIVQSTSLDDFFSRCTEHNIECVYKPENKVKLKYRPQGKEHFVRADTLGEEYTPEAIIESIERMQNALAVAQRFTMHKADEASAITAEQKSANTAVITTDDFIISGAENSITDPETDAPEKEEKADGWASIRGMRICDDIIADMESVGIHSLAEYNALSVTGWTKREELGKKLGKLKSQILAIDEFITKINHLKELSDTYKEYKGLTGFKQSRFRKKNAAAIDDYEQTNSYIWEHIEPYKQDDKAPTVKQLTDRSNDMKLRFNAMAQEYNHLLEVEAVMGKYSREIRKHITGQQNRRAVEQSRERRQGRNRRNSELE